MLDDAERRRLKQKACYEMMERIVSFVFQVCVLAAAIVFGVFAILSYLLEKQAYDDQRIATNVTHAAIVEQQYASRLAEEANRWSFWTYQLALAQLQIAILDLCTQNSVRNFRVQTKPSYSDVLTQGTDRICRL